MITWRLWRALLSPYVAHPIYWMRGLPTFSPTLNITAKLRPQPLPKLRLWITLGGLFTVLITLKFGFVPIMLVVIGVPIFLIIFILPVLMATIGTIYGIFSALLISDTIALEMLQGRFTLMTLTPRGQAGAIWALCSLAFHTTPPYVFMRGLVLTSYTLMSGLLTVFILPFFLTLLLPISSFHLSVLEWALLALAVMLDFLQSTNIGCIIGMLTPTLAQTRTQIRYYALAGFLTVQMSLYLITVWLCFNIWPIMYEKLGWPLKTSYVLICFFTFYAIREAATIVLWHILAERLDAGLPELDNITGIGIRRVLLPTAMARMIRGDS